MCWPLTTCGRPVKLTWGKYSAGCGLRPPARQRVCVLSQRAIRISSCKHAFQSEISWKFGGFATLRGSNTWAWFPVLEGLIDLQELKDSPSNESARLQRAGDVVAALDDRASLLDRRAGRILRAIAPRHVSGAHPRARHARIAATVRLQRRLRQSARLRKRASTKSSSNSRTPRSATNAFARPCV